jgi:tetratricopeptide (TPR) repeat protein
MAKRWKQDETTYLKRYAAKRQVLELAERFATDAETVRAKLDEMGLEAVDHQRLPSEPDPGIEPLEKGVKALYAKKYAQAEKLLAQAESDAAQSEVANRARRYLAAARSRLAATGKSATDPYLEAVYERNQGNFAAALEICSRGGRQSKDERFAHLAASIYALSGEAAKAAKFLQVAIQLNPRNRVLAYHDSDFAELREDPEYADLFFSAD